MSFEDEKMQAVFQLMGLELEEGETVEDYVTNPYGDVYRCDGEEYLVLTDSEAEQEYDQQLDQYIEECIMPEIPSHLQNYFDEDAWKQDASYDGYENLEEVEGTDYYLYRVSQGILFTLATLIGKKYNEYVRSRENEYK